MSSAAKLALMSAAFGVTGLSLWVYAGVNAPASTMPVARVSSAVRAVPSEPSSLRVHPPALVVESEARHAREQVVGRVRDASHGHEPWDDAGLELLRELGSDAVATTDLGCYMAGCIATFTFATAATYRDAVAKLEASPDYAAWTGGKQLTAPEIRADDTVVVAMVFERPD